MEINSEFYKTDLGKKLSSVINTTSKMLIKRCYELIPADIPTLPALYFLIVALSKCSSNT